MSLAALFDAAPGDAPAVIDHDGRRLSFAGLRAGAAALTGALSGVGPGDRVLLVAENCAALAVGVLACARAGAWAAPVNARLTGAELGAIVASAEPRAILFTADASAEAAAHAQGYAARPVAPGLALALRPAPPAEGPEGIAALFHTSGSTGRPKGVMLSAEALAWNAAQAARMRRLGAGETMLLALPCTHIMAFATGLLACLATGATARMMPRFEPDAVLAAFAEGAGVFTGVPQMYAALLRRLGEARPHAPALRQIGTGGAPLDPALKARIEDRFGLPLNNGYGMTEAGPLITSTVHGPHPADGSIGFPCPGTEARIEAPDAGGVGELVFRGPGVMAGYFRDAQATARAFTPEGFLRTGDLARQDGSGAFHVVGRLKELIVRSGFNIHPAEVEAALLAHPSVARAAVVGREASGDEEVIAFVEPEPGAGAVDGAALTGWLRERLAAYKIPSRVVLVADMPLSAAGKVQKGELLGRFGG